MGVSGRSGGQTVDGCAGCSGQGVAESHTVNGCVGCLTVDSCAVCLSVGSYA